MSLTIVLWYLDRASALVLYPALCLAVVTGTFYRSRAIDTFHRFARRNHVVVSVFAVLMTLLHGALGLLDGALVVAGAAPAPGYPAWFFLAGATAGVVGFVLVVVAVLGFLDRNRFSHPRIVHSLAYLGFAFGTVHAVAIGTDVRGLLYQALLATVVFVAAAVAVKLLEDVGRVLSPRRRLAR